MTTERVLPKKRNPLLAEDKTPDPAELASRRRLGATTLQVKPGQVGTSNATKPENLGTFEYAHLRAPLPDNLKSSEIFAPQPKIPHPEAYFLMRRSSDGYVSATGMFKASFPWAKHSEEQAEREYVKSLPSTGQDEVAGNVWIPEKFALELATEYGITPWIMALLSTEPVVAIGDSEQKISSPPKFVFSANDKTNLPPPSSTPARGRGRPRAASPTKGTPSNKLTSPRKRTTKAIKEAGAAAARQASDSLQAALDSTSSVTDSVAQLDAKEEDKVVVNVKTSIETNGDVETEHTTVQVKMPADSADLPLPETTEEMIAKAKEMVTEAVKLEGESSKKAGKRKVETLEAEDEAAANGIVDKSSKKPKLLEQEVKKQKVRNRALMGVAATLAIGAIVPYVLGG